MEKNKEIENNENYRGIREFILILIIALVVIIIIQWPNQESYSSTNQNSQIKNLKENVKVQSQEGVQVVNLRVEGGNYVLEPSIMQKGVPVRIEADISKMPGCSKSIVISAFGIKKSVNSQDNIIEFTPDRTGTFNIACSMNMYTGTFKVIESDGSASDYVEPIKTGGSTCGAGNGGCGCGG